MKTTSPGLVSDIGKHTFLSWVVKQSERPSLSFTDRVNLRDLIKVNLMMIWSNEGKN